MLRSGSWILPALLAATHVPAAPLRLADVPPGRLRGQIQALSPAAQARALKNLAAFDFHTNDLPSLHADRAGNIYYACTFGLPPEEAPATWRSAGPAPAGAIPVSNAPVFHSRPGAPNILFLDFDGHVVTNTRWNSEKGIPRWDCGPFDMDGDRATFNETEQLCIREIWERVAEDFSIFDVDVTNEQPPVWHSRVGHALVTPSRDLEGRDTPLVFPGGTYGGIAVLNAFAKPDYSYDTPECLSPTWIRLPPSTTAICRTVAGIISHELGHNLGLGHDGALPSTEYHPGFDATSNAPSWGPIMGAAYNREVEQWSKGEYYNANQTQDDLAIIAAQLAFLSDDFPDSAGTAPFLEFAPGGTFATCGHMHHAGDFDVFLLATGDGTVTLSATPYRAPIDPGGGNADLVLRLFHPVDGLIASNNPPADTSALLARALPAGTYQVWIATSGAGFPFSPTPSGYTAYGSLGAFRLFGTVAPAPGTVEVLQPNGGEAFPAATPIPIAWRAGFTDPVRIELWRNGALDAIVATNLPNDGSYDWTPPESTAPGGLLRIRVTRESDPSAFDESDAPFSLLQTGQPLFEDFEGPVFPPPGWTQEYLSNNLSWRVQSGGGPAGGANPPAAWSGSNNAILHGGSGSKTLLIAPPVDLSAASEATFSYRICMAMVDYQWDTARVLCRTSAASEWLVLTNYTLRFFPSWTEQSFVLTNYSAETTVAFEGAPANGGGICLDDIRITVLVPVTNRLDVISAHGTPVPPIGTTWHPNGALLEPGVPDAVLVLGATQLVCTGWIGSGDVPVSGTSHACSFLLARDSSIEWLWSTNFAFAATAAGGGDILGPTASWLAAGSMIVLTAAPAAHHDFRGWSGDTDGDTNLPVMTLAMDRPRAVTARFAERLAATHGTPESWLALHYPDTNDFDAAELSDTDADGYPAWQERIAGSQPTNPVSRLVLGSFDPAAQALHWFAVSGRTYALYYLTNLLDPDFLPAITGLHAGTDGPMSAAHSPLPDGPGVYYRLGVALTPKPAP